jgi:hypothetical protein
MKFPIIRSAVALLVLVWMGSGTSPAARGQEPENSAPTGPPSAGQVEKTVDEAVTIRQNTQKTRDEWSAEETELRTRYRDLTTKIAYMEERRSLESERAEALQASVDELSRRLQEATRLSANLQDTLLAVFQRLDAQVRRDLPFLPAERDRRLTSLRADLLSRDLAPSEQLRRLLESLLVEASYGSGFEVYNDAIEVNGESVAADVLRLGRVAVFWRSPDGKRAGLYDPATASWKELDGASVRQVGLAMQMVAGTRMRDLIPLPVGRIAP